MARNSMASRLVVLGKLAVCGATIAAIGLAVVTLSEDGDVAQTSADIADFTLGPKNRSEIFVDTLDRLGHSEPETFDLNGNVVYFSSAYAKGSPRALLDEYQRTFADQGFNRRTYPVPTPDVENQMELAQGLLTGDMIPVLVHDDHVVMAGATIENEARTVADLEKLRGGKMPANADEWASLFKGHRWVEITRDDEFRDRSLVVSTWADDFNIRKMAPGNTEEDVNTDPDVPACPGCTRVLSFDRLGGGKPYRHTGYVDAAGKDAAARYYLDAMTRRGWEITETSRMYMKLKANMEFEGNDAHVLQFTKKDEFLTILSYPDENGAAVQIVRSD